MYDRFCITEIVMYNKDCYGSVDCILSKTAYENKSYYNNITTTSYVCSQNNVKYKLFLTNILIKTHTQQIHRDFLITRDNLLIFSDTDTHSI
jgi:hypothetical protein